MINGCANITGGGLKDNLKRIIPEKLSARINLEKVRVLNIFKWLKKNDLKRSRNAKNI